MSTDKQKLNIKIDKDVENRVGIVKQLMVSDGGCRRMHPEEPQQLNHHGRRPGNISEHPKITENKGNVLKSEPFKCSSFFTRRMTSLSTNPSLTVFSAQLAVPIVTSFRTFRRRLTPHVACTDVHCVRIKSGFQKYMAITLFFKVVSFM